MSCFSIPISSYSRIKISLIKKQRHSNFRFDVIVLFSFSFSFSLNYNKITIFPSSLHFQAKKKQDFLNYDWLIYFPILANLAKLHEVVAECKCTLGMFESQGPQTMLCCHYWTKPNQLSEVWIKENNKTWKWVHWIIFALKTRNTKLVKSYN